MYLGIKLFLMSKLTSFFLALWEWARAWFRPAPADPLAPTAPGGTEGPALAEVDGYEVLGLYRHYSTKDPEACIPYTNVDPGVYPDVWVVMRETTHARPRVIGLEVDGYEVPIEDVQHVASPEASSDLHIAVVRYPRYARYRRPGPHRVVVLVGESLGRYQVQWKHRIPFTIRTVSAE